jgi:hypothetical protein
MGKEMKEYEKELKLAMKRAAWLGICLVLMGFTLVDVAFAEPWFSESNYAYFSGEVDSWDEEF